MKKILYLSILLLIFTSVLNAAEVILTPTSSSTKTVAPVSLGVVFTKSLTVGSYGADVMALKKILNLELSSTTDSSASFTANTAEQVKKLQEKYAIEILIPNGLSAGTGYVGPSTIKKLNALATKYYININDFTAPEIVVVVKRAFMSNLSIGSVGDEVELLKSILNADTSTALVPQNSTNVFDIATAIAVKKFQEKYRGEILTPVGLVNGTGMVFASTRNKLNAILNNTAVAVPKVSTTTTQTVAQKQTFVANFGSNQTDNSTISKNCDGTTLVSTKSGFGSTYETRTTNSTECGYVYKNSSNYSPYNPYTYSNDSNLDDGSNIARVIQEFSIGGPFTATEINHDNKTITIFAPPLIVYKEVDYTKDKNLGNAPPGKNETLGGYPMWTTGLPYNTSQIANFSFAGSTTIPKSGLLQNFSSPVKFTVFAKNGSSTDYTATLKRVTCPRYSPRMPIIGVVSAIDTDARLDGDIANNLITNPFNLNPVANLLSDKYMYITLEYVPHADLPELSVIHKYCNLPSNSGSNGEIGMFIKTTTAGFFEGNLGSLKVQKGYYFFGEVEAPVYKINVDASLFGGEFKYGREYKSGQFSYPLN